MQVPRELSTFKSFAFIDLLHIIFQNINGWDQKAPSLKQIYNKLNPDIILLADTSHLVTQQPIKFFPYKVYSHNTAARYSGVAILIKPYIKHSLINHKFVSDTIAIKVETNTGPVLIAVNYNPPSRIYLPIEDLQWLSRHRSPTYLIADLNAHHRSFDYHVNPRGNDLFNTWLNHGFLKVIGPDQGTYRTNTGRLSKPDLVITNRACYHQSHIQTLDRNISDHAPIKLTISSSSIKLPCRKFEKIEKANWNLFKDYIKNTVNPTSNLNNMPTSLIEPAICTLTNILKEAKSLAIPISSHRWSTKLTTSVKFHRLQTILIAYHNLIELHRLNPAIRYHLTLKRQLIIAQLRTEAIAIQNKNWLELLNQMYSDRKLNPKSFWASVKKVIKKSSNNSFRLTANGAPNGDVLTEAADIEAIFRNDCISKYSPPPLNKIDPTTLETVNEFHTQHPNITKPLPNIDINRLIPDSITLRPIKFHDVVQTIYKFKNKAPGPDCIRRVHLVNVPKIFIVLLTKIFNYALSTGLYPPSFKSGIMIFLGKKGKPLNVPSGYRPITLINILGKIFGKIINDRFVKHMEINKKLDPLQFGFRRGWGTASSLALSYEYIARKKGSGVPCMVSAVARDVSGAFDRVWHKNLIMLFTKLGLPVLFVKVISNFLVNRKIRIKISDFLGPNFVMEAGVPQGAPDSPSFFNVSTMPFEFNFKELLPVAYCTWYCDDQLQIIANPHKKLFAHLHFIKKAIKIQTNFERTRGIITCPEKSIIIPIGHTIKDPISLNMHGEETVYPTLRGRNTTKILGLTISRSSFTASHIEVAHNKADAILRELYKLKDLDIMVKLHLIKALIIPSLTYPVTPLNAASISGMLKLQSSLNKALKFVYNASWPINVISARNLHTRARIKPINQIVHHSSCKLWFKIKEGLAADRDTCSKIINLPYARPNQRFPSSYVRSQKDEPPPLFTANDSHSREMLQYYNEL